MTWLLAWVAVPLITLLLCAGLGLLVERALGVRLSLAVSVGTGFAALIVLTTLLTEFTATARWTSAAVAVLALAGWVLGGRRLLARPRWWSGVAAGATYVVYALPIAVTGVTWAGFVKLDDTPVWMAFAERLVTVGHTTEDLPHSAFGRLLLVNWEQGYPVGAFGQMGVVAQLARIDIAWAVQPLMAVIAAILAWTLYALTDGVVRGRALRAVVSVLAASSALLFGYVMWGGFKEVVLAALLAIACVAVTQGRRDRQSFWAHGVLLALPLAAIFVVFGLAGAVYIAPIAAAELVLMLRTAGARDTARAAGAFLVAFLVLSIPELRSLREQISQLSKASLMSAEDIGNLVQPLKFIQVFGIWPTSDFRVTPQPLMLTTILVGIVAVSAVVGVVVAVRARRPRLPLYAGVALLVAMYSVFSNAWLEGKSLAISSPAMLLAAGVGCAWFMENRLRAAGLILGVPIALGVAASFFFGFIGVWPAPPDRMQELADIGDSQLPAPALMLEYSTPGVRWFLRDLDAEGANEMRWHVIPTLTGKEVRRGAYSDIDDFPLSTLAAYPTLVLRTNLSASRPPSDWRLERAGAGYDVWVADPTAPAVIRHWPLGTHQDPAAPAPCDVVKEAVVSAGPSGRVAFVERAPLITIDLVAGPKPAGWSADNRIGAVSATAPGQVERLFTVPADGEYRLSITGSLFGPVAVSVDGALVATRGPSLNWSGYGTPLPPVSLRAGEHTVQVAYQRGLLPGQGESPVSFGPVQLSQQGPEVNVEYLPSSDALSLCGRRLDWIESVR